MKNKRKNGVHSTRNIEHPIGNKVIFVSNRSTGTQGHNKGYSKLKSPGAIARLKKVKDIIAQKSKFIRASEFAGKGKILEILDVDTEFEGKFGPTVQLKVKESNSNNERIWNITSVRALIGISPLLDKGVTLIHVWTTGSGMDTMYHVREVGSNDGGAEQHPHYQEQQKKKHKIKPLKSQQDLLKKRTRGR